MLALRELEASPEFETPTGNARHGHLLHEYLTNLQSGMRRGDHRAFPASVSFETAANPGGAVDINAPGAATEADDIEADASTEEQNLVGNVMSVFQQPVQDASAVRTVNVEPGQVNGETEGNGDRQVEQSAPHPSAVVMTNNGHTAKPTAVPAPEDLDGDSIVEEFKTTRQDKVNNILHVIHQNPDLLSYDPQNRELSIEGQVVAGSNMKDILKEMVKSSKLTILRLYVIVIIQIICITGAEQLAQDKPGVLETLQALAKTDIALSDIPNIDARHIVEQNRISLPRQQPASPQTHERQQKRLRDISDRQLFREETWNFPPGSRRDRKQPDRYADT